MKLIQLTDPHLVSPGRRLFGLDPAARLRACLEHLAAVHGDADLCVITGDLADAGDPAAYQDLRAILAGFPVPVRLLLGNHDRRGAFRVAFPDHPVDPNGFVQSVEDLGDTRLVFLDTLDEGRGSGRLCDRRLAWLADRLDEAADRPVLVFLHHPPRPVGLPGFDTILLADPDPVMALLRGHGQVRHLFIGHVHVTLTGTMDGIPFAADRGTCHHIQPEMDNPGTVIFVDGAPAFSIVLVDADTILVHGTELPGRRPVVRPGDPVPETAGAGAGLSAGGRP